MKSLLFLLICFVSVSSVSAQVINVPDNSQKDFQERYKGATNIKWSNNVANYTASFKEGDVSCKAHYMIDGGWDYTEKFIHKADVPAVVSESFSKSKYRDNKVKSIVYLENAKKEELYRYEVKSGVTRNYVFFDKTGTLIKTNAVI